MSLSYLDLKLAPYERESAIAVGVSGGPDSLALAWLLKDWAVKCGIALHVLTVDHGLRAESADEARQVGDLVHGWPNVTHRVLTWIGEKPDSRVLEEARHARYELLNDYCIAQNIRFLFLAHHQDDQAETFLFRLAKGSGLDGLGGMQVQQPYDQHLTLVRPLLSVPKQDLINVCEAHHLSYVRDPTNNNTDYARPRLRAARAVLEEEGLSAKRLAITALRLARARTALDQVARELQETALISGSNESVSFDWNKLRQTPEDILVRLLSKTIMQVSALDKDYPTRLEKIEQLTHDLLTASQSFKTTLGGCVFALDPAKAVLSVKQESA